MILTRDGKEITAIYRQDGSEVEEVKDANGRLVYLASREITGTLPLSFSGRGKPLTDYLISGNAIQDGAPSPEAPVDVVGCGVRTGNLWDEEYPDLADTIRYIPIYAGDGDFTLSTTCPYDRTVANLFLLGGNVSAGASTHENEAWLNHNVTVQSDGGYITIAYRQYRNTASPAECKTMLNLGSTALPYEPYGYKLPLTVNGTEYPIYLGQVETTRRIKKLVLTGEETFIKDSGGKYLYYVYTTHKYHTDCLCSHLVSMKGYPTRQEGCSTYNNASIIYLNFGADVMNAQQSGNTVAGLKEYLAAQYAAGTPVTVWYALAEPETAIVNEPLMKIGDYADTISFAQAGVTIPTASGANVLDMASPVKPSEVYVKGKGIKPAGYGQLADVNGVNILDKDGRPINVHGQ